MNLGEHRAWATVAIVILLAATVPASGEDKACGCNRSRVVVEKVEVIHGRSGAEIEITASGPMRILSKRLTNPERFVVDVQDSIPGPRFDEDHRLIPVGSGDIRSIRIGQIFQPGERITRLVVDLATNRQVELTSAQDKLKLRLRPSEFAEQAKATPASGSATMRAPVVAAAALAAPMPASPAAAISARAIAAPPARAIPTTPGEEMMTLLSAETAAPPSRPETPPLARETLTTAPVVAPPAPPLVTDLGAHALGLVIAIEVAPPAVVEVADASGNALAEGATSPAEKDFVAQSADHRDIIRAPGEQAEARLVEPGEAAVPPAAVGVGVTGKSKDKTLGSDDEEAAIKASIATDKNLLASGNGDGAHAVGMRLSGVATAGYYQGSTSSGYALREASPVGGMRLDASGFVHSPGFLNFSVRPQASAGRQSSEGIFPDGQGVAATTTFLGGGVAPLTVSYQRLNRKLVTFGPLDRLAGLQADTFQDSLGANWRLMLRHLPEVGVSFSKYSDSYEPLAALAPKTSNAGRLLAGDITQKVMGWNLQTRYKLERSSQDLINIFDPTQAPYLYTRKDQEARASADRELGNWGTASFVGGKTKSQNEVQGRPFDQSFRFLSGNSFLRPSKKLTLGFRAGVTDNVVGASLDRTLGSTGVAPDQPFILVPSKARLEMVSYSGSAQYAVTNGLRVQTDVVRETTRAPQGSSIATSTSELLSLQAGIAFTHRFRLWQFQTYYAANGGRFTYAATGASRSLGHRANAGVTIGSPQSLEVTATVHGSLQNVTGNTSVYDRSAGANLTLSRALSEHWSLRANYDRERDQYRFTSSQFSSVGNAGSLALVHPRVELSASYNVRDGLTFQADPRLQFVSSSQTGLLASAFPGTLIVPTGATWSSAALAIHPAHKLTGRAGWMRSRQRLQGAVNNSYTDWEASAGYQFRSITVDAGYVFHDQNFAVDMFQRNRFYFRIVREFTVF